MRTNPLPKNSRILLNRVSKSHPLLRILQKRTNLQRIRNPHLPDRIGFFSESGRRHLCKKRLLLSPQIDHEVVIAKAGGFFFGAMRLGETRFQWTENVSQ
jgi:hypothetical protein